MEGSQSVGNIQCWTTSSRCGSVWIHEIIIDKPGMQVISSGASSSASQATSTGFSASRFAPNNNSAKNMIVSYYDNKSSYSGQYTISNVDSAKLTTNKGNAFTYCVVYDYASLYNSSDTGTDHRTFTLATNGTGWIVADMGDHMSC